MKKNGSYQYASAPRSVGVGIKRSKGPGQRVPLEEEFVPQNIMFDRRVVRGSTTSRRPVASNQPRPAAVRPRGQGHGRQSPDTHASLNPHGYGSRPSTPPPVSGRRHAGFQTDTYLEALTDTVPESDAGTQTEALLDRPATPLFVPVPSGIDVATQIEVGELFDFDLEVAPLLEVLVGKTLEAGMADVMEEEEVASIQRHLAAFEMARNVEVAEVQRLEATACRKKAETERRVAEAIEKVAQLEAVEAKVAARMFAKQAYMAVNDRVFANLMATGDFYDPVLKEIESTYLPYFFTAAANRVDEIGMAQQLTTALVAHALQLASQA